MVCVFSCFVLTTFFFRLFVPLRCYSIWIFFPMPKCSPHKLSVFRNSERRKKETHKNNFRHKTVFNNALAGLPTSILIIFNIDTIFVGPIFIGFCTLIQPNLVSSLRTEHFLNEITWRTSSCCTSQLSITKDFFFFQDFRYLLFRLDVVVVVVFALLLFPAYSTKASSDL